MFKAKVDNFLKNICPNAMKITPKCRGEDRGQNNVLLDEYEPRISLNGDSLYFVMLTIIRMTTRQSENVNIFVNT